MLRAVGVRREHGSKECVAKQRRRRRRRRKCVRWENCRRGDGGGGRRQRELVEARGGRHDAEQADEAEGQVATLENVHLVLCRPRGAANVGATLRAASNFGCSCSLVQPDEELVLTEAGNLRDEVLEYACAGGKEVVDSRFGIHDSIEGALAGAGDGALVFAATARVRCSDLELAHLPLRQASRDAVCTLRAGGSVYVLLGNERSGLANDEMLWASAALGIPTQPEPGKPGSALNLSHAAALIAYDIFAEAKEANSTSSFSAPSLAVPFETRQACVTRITAALEAAGCVHGNGRAVGTGGDEGGNTMHIDEVERRAASLLSRRGGLTMREVSLLFRLAEAARRGAATTSGAEATSGAAGPCA